MGTDNYIPTYSNTQFDDIRNPLRKKDGDLTVRGGIRDGADAVYAHKTLSLEALKNLFGRWFSTRESVADQRAKGAREVHDALVNQYGASIAEQVLKNVARETGRSVASLTSEVVTVDDLNLMNRFAVQLCRTDPKTAKLQKALYDTSVRVSHLVASWRDEPTGDGALAKAGSAFRRLDRRRRNYVGKHLRLLARENVRLGMPADDAALAKLTQKLIRIAQSDDFDEVEATWRAADEKAGKLTATVRTVGTGDLSPLIANATDYIEHTTEIAVAENWARGEPVPTIAIEDRQRLAEQGLEAKMAGVSPSEARAAYHKTMGARGATRAALFAAALATQRLPPPDTDAAGNFIPLGAHPERDPHYYWSVMSHEVIFNVQKSLQGVVCTLGNQGQVEGVFNELNSIYQSVELAVRDVAKRRGSDVVSRRKANFAVGDRLATEDPFGTENQEVLDAAMRRAGVSDRAQVKQAFSLIMARINDLAPSQQPEAYLDPKDLRGDSTISVVSVVPSDDEAGDEVGAGIVEEEENR